MKNKSEQIILTSALVTAGIWSFRLLYEMTGTNSVGQDVEKNMKFMIGYGFVFFSLAVIGAAAPELAASFSILVAVGAVIQNGTPLFKDVNQAVAGTTALGENTTPPAPVTEHKENQKARAHG